MTADVYRPLSSYMFESVQRTQMNEWLVLMNIT